MIGIYKISNLLNNKIYIGQSINIERRFNEHCRKQDCLIDKAIQQYGKENFSFEIIEICDLNKLNDREIYWINYYNSISPNGYNQSTGGYASHNLYSYTTIEDVNNIINDIKNSNLTFLEIAKKYNKNVSNISRINKGETHYQSNEKYPLRPKKNYPQIKNGKNSSICPICGNKKQYLSKICIKCFKNK